MRSKVPLLPAVWCHLRSLFAGMKSGKNLASEWQFLSLRLLVRIGCCRCAAFSSRALYRSGAEFRPLGQSSYLADTSWCINIVVMCKNDVPLTPSNWTWGWGRTLPG